VSALLAGLLCGLAVLLLGLRPPSRLSVLLPRPPAAASSHGRQSARGRFVAFAVAGLALALLLPGPWGVVLGAALSVVGPRLVHRLEPATARVERQQLTRDLPLAMDLLAACLAGGASTAAAVRAVSLAVEGPAGERFALVAARLDLGSPPSDAWSALATCGAGDSDEEAAALARTLTRASEGGAPVAAEVARLALDARVRARARAERAAARAAVLGVAPLGLCFLPAFVLVGIVPVVLGLVGPVLRGA
jgi:pilus assembly protein TadC